MSDYTTQIRYICESKAGYTGSTEIPDPEVVVSEARASIFDFDYDLYDENHKEELETKILLHYYTREIGLETYALWHLKLKKWAVCAAQTIAVTFAPNTLATQ